MRVQAHGTQLAEMRDELLAAQAPDAAETTLQAERERTVRSLPTLRLSATRDAEGSAGGKQLMRGELKAERETDA